MKDELVDRVYDAIERHIPNDRVETGDVRDAAIDAIRVVVEACVKGIEDRVECDPLLVPRLAAAIRKLAGGDNGRA